MKFALSAMRLCARFSADYWHEEDRDGAFHMIFIARSRMPAGLEVNR